VDVAGFIQIEKGQAKD